jgi:hypothetical protein
MRVTAAKRNPRSQWDDGSGADSKIIRTNYVYILSSAAGVDINRNPDEPQHET